MPTRGHASSITAAAAVTEVVAAVEGMTREGDVLAWLAADLVLADLVLTDRLGWPAPVLLLATATMHPALVRGADGRTTCPSA